jgi:S1-C subfamily serine protease
MGEKYLEVFVMSKNGSENPLAALSDSLAQAVEAAGAWTVMVDARRRLPASGVIYQPDLVISADHVVQRDEDIKVTLPNGKSIPASVVGRDPGSDLVLLRIPDSGLAPSRVVSAGVRVGQFALALGRPSPNGIQASLGVISARGGPLRTARGGILENFLRSDTIPYPGFSGGPLVDVNGDLIGINTSGLTRHASITIPVGLVWKTAGSLLEHGSVRRGYLGIRSQPVEIPAASRSGLGRDQSHGLLLVGVEPGGPAERGGLIVGDILVGLAGEAVGDPDELLVGLRGALVGKPVAVQVLRGGEPLELSVIVAERK